MQTLIRLFLGKYYTFLESPVAKYLIAIIIQIYNNSRSIYLKSKLKSCGENVNFQFPIIIAQEDMVEIGNNVSFASYVHIWGAGGVKIGDRVMIGSHTAITSITHDYSELIMYNKSLLKPVVIDNDVWIGTHAVIMPGITIGNGAVIGAGCIVTKDVPPFTIMTGVPGKVLKKRPVNKSVQGVTDVS